MKRSEGNVFPIPGLKNDPDFNGISIREHFAAMAMQGILASGANEPHANYEWCANRSVAMADALIQELEKSK